MHAEIAGVGGHSPARFGRNLRRLSDERRHLVASRERLVEHMAIRRRPG